MACCEGFWAGRGAPSPGLPRGEGDLRGSLSWLTPFPLRPFRRAPLSTWQAPAHSGPLPAPQETHRLYRLKLEELTKLQNSCTGAITRQKKQLQELALVLKK